MAFKHDTWIQARALAVGMATDEWEAYALAGGCTQ
jgi:hypothetical protein